MNRWLWVPALLAGVVSLSGCQTINVSGQVDAPVRVSQWIRATGYAPISLQPGETQQQKQLNAMRASKLRAYQELAAQINGQYIFGTTSVESMVLKNDQFKAAVAGIVRGARVVKTYPVAEDTYATVLEVDLNQVEQALPLAQ